MRWDAPVSMYQRPCLQHALRTGDKKIVWGCVNPATVQYARETFILQNKVFKGQKFGCTDDANLGSRDSSGRSWVQQGLCLGL